MNILNTLLYSQLIYSICRVYLQQNTIHKINKTKKTTTTKQNVVVLKRSVYSDVHILRISRFEKKKTVDQMHVIQTLYCYHE